MAVTLHSGEDIVHAVKGIQMGYNCPCLTLSRIVSPLGSFAIAFLILGP